MLLEGLNQINWAAYGQHVYGPAEKIPSYIRNLLADNEFIRLSASNYLIGGGQDMGFMCAATPIIVPFIIELLSYDEVPYKDEILGLLLALARSLEYDWSGLVRVDSRRLYLQVYDAIEVGLDIYLKLSKNGNADVQWASLELLACLSGKIQEISESLAQYLPHESNPEVRVLIVSCISRLIAKTKSLDKQREQYADFFRKLIHDDNNFSVQSESAYALINILVENWRYIRDDDIPDFAVAILYKEFNEVPSKRERVVKALSKWSAKSLLPLLQ